MELLLTDKQADYLIHTFKTTLKYHNIQLEDGQRGAIPLKSFKEKHDFTLIYFYSKSKKVIHFMDDETKHTLLRININRGFHKNADGTKIYGNRINIFSEEEAYAKQLQGDTHTHYKCFPLPYKNIKNTEDFFDLFTNLCSYANIEKQGKIDITLAQQESLF